MTGGASEVYQPSFREQENFVTIRKCVLVHLRFDVGFLHAFGCVERIDLNLIIEVADVGDDRLIFHPLHVFERDDVDVAAGSDVDIAAPERVFDSRDFVAFHCGLQGVDGINFGNDDTRSLAAQRLRTTFADVAVPTDHGDFSGKHHIQRAIQSIHQRMPAAVKIVEFGFGDRIVHVNRGNQQPVFLRHFVKAMHAGRGFFRNAAPILRDFVPAVGILTMNVEQ